MARKVRDKSIDSREARLKLKPQGKPYWRSIEKTAHLGYRRLKGTAGTWCSRIYQGAKEYAVERIGAADDTSDADGVLILDYWQAVAIVRERAVKRAFAAAGKHHGPFTVGDALDLYLEFLEGDGRTPDALADAHYRAKDIREQLGDVEAAELSTDKLRKWRNAVAKAPKKLRTAAGEAQRYRDVGTDEAAMRSRRSTARRTWNIFKAALTYAYREGRIPSDAAWKKLEAIKDTETARARYLSIAESKRLLNACTAEFRPLVQAALLTGARYGGLITLKAGDFNRDAGTLTMRTRKGKGEVKTFDVHLTKEGVDFFKAATARCASAKDLVFVKANGQPWRKSQQKMPMLKASTIAKINPAAHFHILRHTWASHAVMNGMALLAVAQNLGHSDTSMVEKHYGHLAPGYRQQQVRAFAPTFDIEPDAAAIG